MNHLDTTPIETGDGSQTLFSQRYGETFHSINGAVTESRHVFLEATGVADRLRAGLPTRVLEIGFGLGLNALLTADLARSHAAKLDFQSFEHDPTVLETAHQVAYDEFLAHPEIARLLREKLRLPGDSLAAADQRTSHATKTSCRSGTNHLSNLELIEGAENRDAALTRIELPGDGDGALRGAMQADNRDAALGRTNPAQDTAPMPNNASGNASGNASVNASINASGDSALLRVTLTENIVLTIHKRQAKPDTLAALLLPANSRKQSVSDLIRAKHPIPAQSSAPALSPSPVPATTDIAVDSSSLSLQVPESSLESLQPGMSSSTDLTAIVDSEVRDCHPSSTRFFDAVYLDAFSPDTNPECWSLEFLQALRSLLAPHGRLSTYSAKGSVRRAMIAAGFTVKKIAGPPGKREMLVAIPASSG